MNCKVSPVVRGEGGGGRETIKREVAKARVALTRGLPRHIAHTAQCTLHIAMKEASPFLNKFYATPGPIKNFICFE